MQDDTAIEALFIMAYGTIGATFGLLSTTLTSKEDERKLFFWGGVIGGLLVGAIVCKD